MELNEIAVCSPMSTISQDTVEQVCPICSDEVRLYFINLNEKIKMCKNLSCDYPFGYEPIEIMREENGFQATELKSCSQKSTYSNSTRYSQASTSSNCDMEKLCTVLANDDIPGLDLDQIKRSRKWQKSEAEKNAEEIKRNVEQIREMTKSMCDVKPKTKSVIKNQNWIKNLSYLQGLSGFSLVKPEEMKKIKVNMPTQVLQSGDLKIDIDKSNKSNIKIEIKDLVGANATET